MVEEVADVCLASLPVLSYQGGGPRLLVEGLVPDLIDAIRRCPASSDPRIRTVEEEQPAETLRILPGEPLGHVSAHVVADDPEPLKVQSVSQAAQVLHEIAEEFLRRIW